MVVLLGPDGFAAALVAQSGILGLAGSSHPVSLVLPAVTMAMFDVRESRSSFDGRSILPSQK